MKSDDIGAILLSLSESGLIDNKDLFEKIKHIDGVVRAVKFATEMDYESLYYLFAYKLEQTIEGLVEHVTPSYDAKLIFKHLLQILAAAWVGLSNLPGGSKVENLPLFSNGV